MERDLDRRRARRLVLKRKRPLSAELRHKLVACLACATKSWASFMALWEIMQREHGAGDAREAVAWRRPSLLQRCELLPHFTRLQLVTVCLVEERIVELEGQGLPPQGIAHPERSDPSAKSPRFESGAETQGVHVCAGKSQPQRICHDQGANS
eukprot:6042320-Prymnesium_polylepis.1